MNTKKLVRLLLFLFILPILVAGTFLALGGILAAMVWAWSEDGLDDTLEAIIVVCAGEITWLGLLLFICKGGLL